jgi:hypothetical protein
MITAEELDQLRIHEHVAFRIVRLRTVKLARLDADDALVPTERGPGKGVDLGV